MRRMSFALTKFQIRHRLKLVTRRKGWQNLKPGEWIQAVEKCMGLKKGQKQICLMYADTKRPVRLICVRNEPEIVEEVTRQPIRAECLECKKSLIRQYCSVDQAWHFHCSKCNQWYILDLTAQHDQATEAELEGFHNMTCEQFYTHLVKKTKVRPGAMLNRIEFRYVF